MSIMQRCGLAAAEAGVIVNALALVGSVLAIPTAGWICFPVAVGLGGVQAALCLYVDRVRWQAAVTRHRGQA